MSVFHKIVCFLMAIVVLFSTMAITIDMHYCGDTLVDTAVFQNTRKCGMEIDNSIKTTGDSTMTKNCCHDKQIIMEGQDELQLKTDTFSFEQQVFLTSFVYTYSNRFKGLDKKVSFYKEYEPPLVNRQLYKIDESYLI